eukprot:757644-Amphidinium_carterae.1
MVLWGVWFGGCCGIGLHALEANFHVPSSEQMKGWQQEPPMVGMPPQDHLGRALPKNHFN